VWVIFDKNRMEKSESENNTELGDKKSYAGIPEAEFVEDVEAYMSRTENNRNVDEVLKKLDNQHAKYKFMEYNLLSKKKRLQNQVPELKRSLTMIEKLEEQKKEFETQFLLSEQVFAKAKVPPTETVFLWLGANVMLEYSLKDAQELLTQNIAAATRNLNYVEHDLDFLRDQFTTTEVNMARVFNWDVKRRQAAKAAAK
jgi:prefoldin subunit 5